MSIMAPPRRRAELTYVATVVDILGVATSRNRGGGGNAVVDCVDGTERVDVDLQVREGFVGARLEGGSITARIRIERVDGGENGVRVLAGPSATGVRSDVAGGGVPVALWHV